METSFSDIHAALNSELTIELTRAITRKSISGLSSSEVLFLLRHKNAYYMGRYASNWLMKFHKQETLIRCKESRLVATNVIFWLRPDYYRDAIGQVIMSYNGTDTTNTYYFDMSGKEIADILVEYHNGIIESLVD